MLCQRADIGRIAEDAHDRLGRPVGRTAAVRFFAVQPREVGRGVGDALIGQPPRDRAGGISLQAHVIDAPHDARRLPVDDRRTFFVRARFVAVGIGPVGVLARAPVALQHRADLLGGIRCVPFIEHVHDGHHVHARPRPVRGVHVVRKSDKANAVGGKDIVDILPDADIVAPEAGQVFDDDRVDLSLFGVLQKARNARAFEVGARPAVVRILARDRAAIIRDILQKHRALIFNGHRLARLLVVAREAHIDPRTPEGSRHKPISRSTRRTATSRTILESGASPVKCLMTRHFCPSASYVFSEVG